MPRLREYKEIPDGETVWMAFVMIDLVGSRRLQQDLTPAEFKRRCDFFRNSADYTFERFGARMEGSPGWQGEGRVYYFVEGDPENAEEQAVKASYDLIGLVRIGLEVEVPVRIAINSGAVEFQNDLGRIDHPRLSHCKSLNDAAPEISILIGENVYDALPSESDGKIDDARRLEWKKKFVLCGTVKKDGEIAFLFPKDKMHKLDAALFLPKEEDTARDRRKYLEAMEAHCRTLPSFGIRQTQKFAPSIRLTEAFVPPNLKKIETRGYAFERTPLEDFGPEVEERPSEGEGPEMDAPRAELFLSDAEREWPPRPFKEIFGECKNSVVLGDPGSGKTTLLKWLCLIHSRGEKAIWKEGLGAEGRFPILVPIAGLLNRHKGFISAAHALEEYFDGLQLSGMSSVFLQELQAGKCFVLLDGLDEFAEKTDRIAAARYIEIFMQFFQENRFVVTSRIIGYEEISVPDIEEHILCDMTDTEIEAFIRKWLRAFEETSSPGDSIRLAAAERAAADLAAAILRDDPPGIRNLAKNPFLLSFMVILQKQGQTLPRSRARLYDLCTETLFETWHYARTLFYPPERPAPIPYEEGVKVFAPLALWMHESKPGGVASKDEIKEKIIEILVKRRISDEEATKSAETFFKQIADQSQLLIDRGGDRWGFRHRTFQEFLAARALVMSGEYMECAANHAGDAAWREVLLLTAGWIGFVIGNEKEVTKFVEKMLEEPKNDFDRKIEQITRRRFLLAARCIAENLGVSNDLEDLIFKGIEEIYLRNPIKGMHTEIEGLLQFPGFAKLKKEWIARSFEILTHGDPNDSIREGATRILGRLRSDDKRTFILLEGIIKDKREKLWIRTAAIEAVSRIGHGEKKATDLLAKILNNRKEHGFLRAEAAEALGIIGAESNETADLLAKILEDRSENDIVRHGAAWPLGMIIRDKSKILQLCTNLIQDVTEDSEIRYWASVALGNAGQARLFEILNNDGENKLVRVDAAIALSQYSMLTEDQRKIIIGFLEDREEFTGVRQRAAIALGMMRGSDTNNNLALLVKILKDKNEDRAVRLKAVSALGDTGKGDDNALNLLVDLATTSDEDIFFKKEASEAVWKLTG